MSNEMQEMLMRFAKSDLDRARREGELLIAHTKLGTLRLEYSEGVYTLMTQGFDAKVIAEGKPAVVKPVLASAYQVVSA